MRFLLDVNVLVAMAVPAHPSHQRAHTWFRREPDRLWATCALTQGGFLRVASRYLGGSSDGVQRAFASLERDCQSPNHEFWIMDTDLRALSDAQRSRLNGRNHIADMQLLLLAHRHRGQLATMDTGISELAVATRFAESVLVL